MLDCVQRGVDYLNANYPGWENRINLKALKMHVCQKCILGQLFGHFEDGIPEPKSYLTSYEWATEHGFNQKTGINSFTQLNIEWIEAIKTQRLKSQEAASCPPK